MARWRRGPGRGSQERISGGAEATGENAIARGLLEEALECTGFGDLLARADAILWEEGAEALEEGRRRPEALAAQGG